MSIASRAMVRRPYRPHRVYALKGQINPAQGKAKRHLGLRDAKRKSPALCNPPPILLGQDGGRIAERGTADAAIRPRVPLRPGGRRSTLGWVDLPLRGASGTSHLFVESFAPPPPGVSPRAIIRRPYRPRGGGHPPGIIINNPTIQQLNMPLGTSTPRIRPPSTLLFGGLVVCVLIHPLAHMAISHMG